MNQNSAKDDFTFLKETPVNAGSDLEFGHKEIIATLENIISKTSHNLTIGLFGSWGTGKSTIIEVLKCNLKTKYIPLIIFDVWKHEGDALRRTFLKEVDDQLSVQYGDDYVKKKHILQAQVYTSSSVTTEKYKVYKEKLLLNLGLLFLFTFVITLPVIILYNLFKYVFDVNIFNGITLPAVSTLLISVFSGGLLFKYLDSFIKLEKTDTKQDRFQDPHEFEQEFANLVANLKNEKNKLVVTFDNLDRISGDNALKIISTIKTFLNDGKHTDKTVFFLIPCDVLAIKNHITIPLSAMEGAEKEMYLEEFLRKFFNTSVWIPEFFSTELESFASAKLTETKIAAFKNDYLSWLITRVFFQNPRQIVQFINLLLSNYLLLKEFCINGGLSDRTFYEKNIIQLAKFLLIKQKFPEHLELYRKSGTYNLYDSTLLEKIKDENFKALLNQTEDIYISSLEPYFRYRVSKAEQEIPGVSRLIQFMDNEDENVSSYATELDIKAHAGAFASVVKTYLQPIVNPVKKTKFINQYFKLATALKLDISPSLIRDITNYLCAIEVKKNIYFLETTLVNELLFSSPVVTKKNRESIVAFYLEILKDKPLVDEHKAIDSRNADLSRNLIEFILKNTGCLNELTAKLFKDYIATNINDPLVKELIIKHPERQEALLNTSLKLNTIKAFTINNKTQLEILDNLELIDLFLPKVAFCTEVLDQMLSSWDSLFSEELVEKYPDHSQRVLKILSENYHQTEESGRTEEILKKYELMIVGALSIIGQLSYYHIKDFVPFMLSVYQYNSGKTGTRRIFTDYLEFCPEDAVKLFIDLPMGLLEIVTASREIQAIFIGHYTANKGIAELTKEYLNLPLIKNIISTYIERGLYQDADTYLHEFRNQFDDADLVQLRNSLIEKFQFLVANNTLTDLSAVVALVKFVFDDEANAISETPFWTGINDLIADAKNMTRQQKGYELFSEYEYLLSKLHAKTFTESLLDRIISDELFNNYFAQETLFKLFNHLEAEGQHTYMTYLFEEIMLNTTLSNIMLLCSKFIANKYKPSLMEFYDQIEDFVNDTEKALKQKAANLADRQVLLKEIYNKLRKESSPEAAELTAAIKDLL